jgi:SAM-dependent methyltransferase
VVALAALHDIRPLVEEVPEVIQEVSPRDEMYPGDPEHYFGYGEWALRLVRLAALSRWQDNFDRILDFACGHGRVLRTFRAAFPHAKLTACDISRDGVDFCAETFAATPIYSSEDPNEIELHDDFDLIWCGSLVTHLDKPRWADFLELFHRSLRPHGLLLFTTAGRFAAERFRREPTGFEDPAFVERFDAEGFSYTEYQAKVKDHVGIRTYGQSLSSLGWVLEYIEKQGLFGVVHASEKSWGEMDVIACEIPTLRSRM